MKAIKKIVSSPSVLVLFDQAVFSGTNFLLTLFLAQKLDIKDFGLFSSIVLFTYLGMSITNALIIQPFQVSIGKVSQKKEYYVFLFLGQIALLFILILLVKLMVLLIPIPIDYNKLINNFLCFIVGYLVQDFFRKLQLGIGQILHVILIDILFLVLIIVFFYFLADNISLTNTLWIIGISNLVSSFAGLFFIVKNYQKPVSWKWFAQNHILQGKWLLSTAVLQWSSSNFFVLVSGIYLGIEALGALRLVQSFFGVINIALATVENYFLPKVALLYNENVAQAKKYLLEITVFGAVFFGILLSILFLFSTEIIVLAGGEKYHNYDYVVKIISVLYFFIFLSYPIRIAVRVLVLNKIFFIGYLLSFAFSILSFHFLLKYSGLYGAVSGLIMNQIIMILYWQSQLKKNQFQLWK
jgi:O-antigen/teichoic acid export membrane protein